MRAVKTTAAAMMALVSSWMLHACGTVAGNPKKPSTPTSPNPPTQVIAVDPLPLIGFDVPSEATTDDAALQLAAVAQGEATQVDATLLRQTARRMDKIVKRVDALSTFLNGVIDAHPDDGDAEGTLRFSGEGDGGKLSGRIGRLAGDQTYDHEAVVCRAGTPFLQFRWNADGDKIELTTDFAAKSIADEPFGLVSSVVVSKSAGLTVDIHSQGTWDESLVGQDGGGLLEHLISERLESGEVRIRSVADLYDGELDPAAIEGDEYLTGRLVPKDGAAAKAYQATFVGYFKGFKLLCGAGFDDDDAGIWHPDGSGPRFCLGRPLGARKFKSLQEWRATVAALEDVGIVRKDTLKAVAIPASVSCD